MLENPTKFGLMTRSFYFQKLLDEIWLYRHFHANEFKDRLMKFPPKKLLALNWRERENYFETNVLYVPQYDHLESGDSFCLIEINGRWTLVIIQCTIVENTR